MSPKNFQVHRIRSYKNILTSVTPPLKTAFLGGGVKVNSTIWGRFFFYPPVLGYWTIFWDFFKIDQTKQFQWLIMYSKVN